MYDIQSQLKHIQRKINHVNRKKLSDCLACQGSDEENAEKEAIYKILQGVHGANTGAVRVSRLGTVARSVM
jgi:hypothetical protein